MNLNEQEKEIYDMLDADQQFELQQLWADTKMRQKVVRICGVALGAFVVFSVMF